MADVMQKADGSASARAIGEARDCSDLIEIYRARKCELGLTDRWFDDYSGLSRGHLGKLFGDAQVKQLGPVSIATINAALAVKFIVVVDEEAEQMMRGRWEGRERPMPMLAKASSRAIARFTPIILKERAKVIAPLGGRARALKLSPQRRSRIARQAARARWARE